VIGLGIRAEEVRVLSGEIEMRGCSFGRLIARQQLDDLADAR
jgi:hypothetical protein